MSEAIKPTPGPWTVEKISKGQYVISGAEGELIESFYEVFGEQRLQANMRLITEAGTVHHETGLTPCQLVKQRDALAEALKSVIENCEQHGDFRNGVTDPTGTIDEGMVAAAEFFGKARAALAIVKGATP